MRNLIMILAMHSGMAFAQSSCLISEYKFSGNANDSKGSNHGTVYGATLTTDRFGTTNSAYQFTASGSNYIAIPPNPFLLSNYSYSVWVKPASNPSSGNAVIFLSIGSGNDQNMQIENNQNNGAMGYLTGFTLTAYNKSGSTISTGGVASGSLPSTNTWYHVVCTRDSNYFKVYVNGCLAATSASQSGALPYYGTSGYEARIGCRRNGSKFFNGVLDDISIYSCALSAQEVSRLYNGYQPFKASRDTAICANAFKPFKIKAGKGYCTYKWIDISNRSVTLGTDSQLLINTTSSKTYRVFNNTGDSATVKVVILPKPVVKLGNDTTYCGFFQRILDAGGKKAKSFLWNTNASTRTILTTSAGWYGVEVTDSLGCKATDSIQIGNNPVPKSNLGNDTLICGVYSKTLDAGSDGVSYLWGSTDTGRFLTASNHGLFSVRIINQFGCVTFDSVVIDNPRIRASYRISDTVQCRNTNTFQIRDSSLYVNDGKGSTRWIFGDNNSLADSSVVRKYFTDSGTYSVKLVIKSTKGCRDSIQKSVRVNPNARIDFSINDSTQCFNRHTFDFVNNSVATSGSLAAYQWVLGDDSTRNTEHVYAKSYLKDSSYTITLVTRTNLNCFDTLRKNVSVYPNSRLGFSRSLDSQCFKGNSLDLINTSSVRTGSISTYLWFFGDGDFASLKDVVGKRYYQPDTYTVALQTTTNQGCRDTLKKTVVIFPNSDIGFTTDIDTQCFERHKFNFINTSSVTSGALTYSWDLGDGSGATDTNVLNKKYLSFGRYSVRLITRTNLNCLDTLNQDVIVFASPVADFDIDNNRQCFRDNAFSFTNKSSINNGSIVQYTWFTGDGLSFSSNSVLSHVYASEDTFNVSLISISDMACKDTIEKMVVTFAQPVADFVIPNDSQCWQKNYFNINNQTKLKYGSMLHYWDFGDGSSDTNYTPLTKKYANASASYIVRYRVLTDHGCSDSLKNRIVLLERPIADILVNDSVQCFKSHLFNFSNNTSFSAMNTVSYNWNYGNGIQSAGFTPLSAVYTSAIYHPVQLIAYSYLTNCYDTSTQFVLPAPHATPLFSIDRDSQCFRFNQFKLADQSNLSFGSMRYDWRFGDGSTSTLKNPVKTYTAGTDFNIKLLVSTNHNCLDSVVLPVVLTPQPKALFDVNDTAQCLNQQSFVLNNRSTVDYGSLRSKWEFDDGDSVISNNVADKSFRNGGVHTIQLSVRSINNCYDTLRRMVSLEIPGSTFVTQSFNDSQCLKGNNFSFKANCNDPGVQHLTYLWDFADGNSETLKDVYHRYAVSGKYRVMLETTSANTCKDTAYDSVWVHPHPVSAFTATSPCYPDPVVFSSSSSISDGSIKSHNWLLGNGSSSVEISPTHLYASAGNYTITLITESTYGCKDTLRNTSGVIVRRKPSAAFTFSRLPDQQFDVATLKFQNNSSVDVQSSFWRFSDGNTSTERDPEQDFADTFRRLVTLIVTNTEGCTDTAMANTGALITDFVFYIPDVFSPDGNQLNETFKPIATPYVRYYIMEIFNRWGEKVFTTNDILSGWDGQYDGVDCEQGVYLVRVYLVPMRGPIQHTDKSLTLLR